LTVEDSPPPLESAPSHAPWAMQLAVRDDRPHRPTHLAVCEAAASAVVALLADPRAVAGEWAGRVRRWQSGPVRKVVRRGRGVRFAATDSLDGVEVERRGACVRAFVPCPTDAVPPELARLQVGGTQMPDVGEPAPEVPGGVTVALTALEALSTGKAAAQCGHAAQYALAAMEGHARERWAATGWAVRVVLPDVEHWKRMAHDWPVAIRDGGFTEVAPGTLTTLARW
jgi:peptidyl-tRNA hydrolase